MRIFSAASVGDRVRSQLFNIESSTSSKNPGPEGPTLGYFWKGVVYIATFFLSYGKREIWFKRITYSDGMVRMGVALSHPLLLVFRQYRHENQECNYGTGPG